jgi:hypothetical protein
MRFSDFLLTENILDFDFIVGYRGDVNLRINTSDFLNSQIVGFGTEGFIPTFVSTSGIGNSKIYQDGDAIVINDTISRGYQLDVYGEVLGGLKVSALSGLDVFSFEGDDGVFLHAIGTAGSQIVSTRSFLAPGFVIPGGTSSQFLKADGTLDSNSYYLASNPSLYITLTALSAGAGIAYNNTTGVITSIITQYTDALARAAISESATGLDYDNTTGVFSITSGYAIPTTASQSNWDAAYNDKINSASVTGTSTKTLTLTQQDGGTIVASWTDIDTGLTSVGISMPSAFTVSNSPLTSNGVLSVTGAGTISQYIRGDGSLATFPSLTGYVPYTGATSNVNLGLYGLTSEYITLNPSPTTIPTAQGSIYFDDEEQTIAAVLNGSTMKIGEDLFYQIKNQTGSTITKGTALGFGGVIGSSGRVLAVPFLANGTSTSLYFLGVAYEDIIDGGDGKALAFGKVRGVNTNAYPAGTVLYASTTVAGGYQTTAPIAPNNIIVVAAVVTQGTSNGTLLVRPTLGSNINNDEGVKITTPTTGDLLQLQASGLWENKTKAQILNGTPLQFVKGDGSLDSTAYQPLLTNPITGTGTAGQVAFWNGTNTQTGDSGLVWDNTNKRLTLNSSAYQSFSISRTGSENCVISYNSSSGSRFAGYDVAGNTFGFSTTQTSMGSALVQINALNGQVLTSKISAGGGFNKTANISFSSNNTNISANGLVSNGIGVGLVLVNTNSTVNNFSNIDFRSGTADGRIALVNRGINQSSFEFIHDKPSGLSTSFLINSSGNVIIQDGGTFTDAGFRLDVNGTARVQGDTTITGATSITRAAGQTALTASFGGTNSNIVLQSHGSVDFSRIQIGTGFTLSREGGGSSAISSGTGLSLRATFYDVQGQSDVPADFRLTGNYGLGTPIFGAYNSSTSTLIFGNSFSSFSNLQITYARNIVWHQTDTSTAPSLINSALFSLSSTTRGFLPPRMTTTERNAIATPATGLQLYNTTSNTPNFYNGTSWVSLQTHDAVTIGTANGLSLSGQVLSLGLASGSANGALSSTDWTTFNNKQPALNGTGFVKISGTTISYDNSTYLTTAAAASTYLPLAGGTLTGALVGTSSSFSGNLTVSTGNATGGGIILADDGDIVDLNDAFLSLRFSSGVRVFSANRGGLPVITLANTGDISANGNITGANLSGINTGDQTLSSLGGVPTSRTITINGTTQDLSDNRIYNVGTVTSLAALTLGTSGTDLSSSVANGTTTPVITLNVPTASASNRGALSAADWTTFNNKIGGSGTTNYLAKFTAGGTVGNSNLINDANGNLGLGVTPSAWGVVGPVIEFTAGGFIASQGSVNTIYMGSNHFYNGTNFIYKQNGFATQYQVGSGLGNHQWYVAPSGTAGNAISFTQAMTLFSDGNLLLTNGTVSNAGFKLDVNGTGRFTQGVNMATSSGNVGIGTDSPNSLLQIGSSNFSITGRTSAVYGISDSQTIFTIGRAGVDYPQLLDFGVNQSGLYSTISARQFTVANENSLILQPNGGNVGIGTTSPSVALELAGATNFSTRIRAAKTASGTIEIGADRDTFGSPYISAVTNSNLDFFTNDTHRMRITSGGNVGIGIASPTAKVEVAGNILINSGFGIGYRLLDGSSITREDEGMSINSNNNRRMTITTGGNVLINTTNDTGAYKLDVNGTGRFSGDLTGTSASFTGGVVVGLGLSAGIFNQNTPVSFSTNGTSNSPSLNLFKNSSSSTEDVFRVQSFIGAVVTVASIKATGAATFSSSVTATAFFTSSDKRKKDIISQDGDLAIYRFKGDDQIHYGYIAQDMQSLYPNQVSTDNDGMLSLNYIEILVKKVHDLETKLKKHGLD